MSSFDRLVRREVGGGGTTGPRRRGPPAGRPPFVAHPCTTWSDDHARAHLQACVSGRDPATGQWDIDPDNADEVWAWLWESMPKTRPDGSLDWGAWQGVIREIEVR